MPSATNLSKLIEFRCLLGLCLAGALSGCAMQAAEGEEGTTGQVSDALDERYWIDLGRPTAVDGSKVDALDLAVSYLTATDADVWVVGADKQVWNRTPATDWVAVGKPSGVSLAGVSAARRGSKTDLVVTDTAGTIWCRTRNSSGGWGTWATVGASPGQARGKPAASQVTGDDRLDVWVRGTDDGLWHAYRFGTQAWSAWIYEGTPTGGLKGPPAAYTRKASPLTIDVVARGTGNGIDGYRTWHRGWLNGWHDWDDPHLQTLGDPSMGVNGFLQAYIVAQGVGTEDTAFVDRYWNNGAWNAGNGFPVPLQQIHGGPVFISNNRTPDLYVRGLSNNVLRFR